MTCWDETNKAALSKKCTGIALIGSSPEANMDEQK